MTKRYRAVLTCPTLAFALAAALGADQPPSKPEADPIQAFYDNLLKRARDVQDTLAVVAPEADREKFLTLWLKVEIQRGLRQIDKKLGIDDPQTLDAAAVSLLATLKNPAKACPECGRPLPPGSDVCPFCHPSK